MDITDKTFEEVSKIVDDLLIIKSDNLDMEALANQKIFTELHRMYVQSGRRLMKLINQKDRVENQRNRHYAGKMPAAHYKDDPLNEAVLKGDIPQLMNIDPVVVEIRNLVKEQEYIVNYLEASKSQLKARGFDIKTAVEWRKVMMGA